MIRAVCWAALTVGCAQSVYLGPLHDVDARADAVAMDAVTPDAAGADVAPGDGAAVDDRPPVVAVDPCGNGTREPGETCATCPSDLVRLPEIANDLDDNCNGQVDEGVRIRLGRLHCANGMGCGNPAGDWDHCFSTSPANGVCFHAPGSTFVHTDCLADDTAVYVYPPSLGDTSTVPFGAGELYRLWDCFRATTTQHVYVPGDDIAAMQTRWGYVCVPIGYVSLNRWPHGDSRRVYAHIIELVRDVYYDFAPPPTVVEGGACAVTEDDPHWWAWND